MGVVLEALNLPEKPEISFGTDRSKLWKGTGCMKRTGKGTEGLLAE